jgi:hypothetical protein
MSTKNRPPITHGARWLAVRLETNRIEPRIKRRSLDLISCKHGLEPQRKRRRRRRKTSTQKLGQRRTSSAKSKSISGRGEPSELDVGER